MIGKVIGNYQITSELAQGGMGAVFRGRHVSLPREVVVKSILLASFPAHAQEQLKARFLREAYVQSQLSHPNIVGVYEFFTASENYYLVMEFVDGMSLRDLMKRQGALAPNQAAPLFKQALAALDYAHSFTYVDESGNRHSGIIHRDIKPANLLLDGMARLKITDFGIVKLAGESSLTRTGFNPGTIEYMSPEQIRGLAVDARSDLYSLGVTFYEMLTGRLPFPQSEATSEYEVLRSHVEVTPPAISLVKPDVPPALAALVMRALEKNPSARFQSAAEFLEAVQSYETSVNAKGQSAEQPIAIPSQPVTHSMTELLPPTAAPALATDPIPAVTTSAPAPRMPAPRPVAPVAAANPEPDKQYQTNIIPPSTVSAKAIPSPSQRQERPVKQLSSQTGSQPGNRAVLLSIGALVVLVVIAAVGYFLWQQNRSSETTTSTSTTPTSVASQTPVPAPPVAAAIQQGYAAEQEERYVEAIKLYDDYLRDNPQTADANSLKTRVAELKKLQGVLTVAELELKQQDYAAAKRDFNEALKLRPESKRAQTGLTETEAKSSNK